MMGHGNWPIVWPVSVIHITGPSFLVTMGQIITGRTYRSDKRLD